MKVAVVSASFGGIDTEKQFCAQDYPGVEIHRYFFTEHNTPFPLPNLPPRLQAKYFKTQAHHILPEYTHIVWIDANIQVTASDFVETIISKIISENITIQLHHERTTIEEEIAFISSSTNPYLLTRYGKQPLSSEYYAYLSDSMPPSAPLYSCNVFAYCTTDSEVVGMMNEWWSLCLQWSWFDQSAFSYLAYKYPTKVIPIDLGGVTTSPYYTLHSHTQWDM